MLGWAVKRIRRKGGGNMTETPQSSATSGPDLAEGYPTLAQVLRGISNHENVPDEGVTRVEVNTFASGDATFRVWVVGSDEAQGGYLEQL
jgi:hypothetical protein